MGWGKQRAVTNRLVNVAIEQELPIVVVSMGSSGPYTGKLKEAGVKVIHAISSVKHAQKAEEDGVDAIVCEGYEAVVILRQRNYLFLFWSPRSLMR